MADRSTKPSATLTLPVYVDRATSDRIIQELDKLLVKHGIRVSIINIQTPLKGDRCRDKPRCTFPNCLCKDARGVKPCPRCDAPPGTPHSSSCPANVLPCDECHGEGRVNGEAVCRKCDGDGVVAGERPTTETGWPYNEKVQCAKRIMAAVDTYHERPDAMNRSALRGVILTELGEYASGVSASDGKTGEQA